MQYIYVMASEFSMKFTLACLFLMFQQNTCYKIPDVILETFDDGGFHISIPDEMGVQRVFYMLQIDDSCPVLMDYITVNTNGSWTSSQSFSLRNNDKLRFSVLVQYNDHIYEKSETRVILTTRMLTTQQTDSRIFADSRNVGTCDIHSAAAKSSKNCKPTISLVGGSSAKPSCKGELLFEDNFSEANLNRKVWTYDIRQRMYHVEEELVAFDDSPRHSYVREGHLHIVPVVASEVTEGTFQLGDRCTAIENRQLECSILKGSFYKIKPPVYSAQLHTRNAFSFKYGKIVVRAKFPKGDWLFPYLMLQPVATHAESHYANQMRIAFARGNFNLSTTEKEDISGHRLYGGMIVWHEGRAVQILKNKLDTKHYGDNFHNYTMIWQRNKITLMVDAEIYGEIYEGLQFFERKCFIILGVTVGGFLNFDDNLMKDVKPYENLQPRAALDFWQSRDKWTRTWGKSSTMLIDYVRVYAD